MFYVIEVCTGEVLFTSPNKEACEHFCEKIAYTENYGLCRTWDSDGCLFMDCGRVFAITDNPSGLKW